MQGGYTPAGDVPSRRRPAGFTLTEVVMASALLIAAIAPILKALTTAHYSSSLIERKTLSLTLARKKLEDISFTEPNESLGGSYLCTVADKAVSADLRKITVSVGCDTDGNGSLAGGEVLVVLETLLAKRW